MEVFILLAQYRNTDEYEYTEIIDVYTSMEDAQAGLNEKVQEETQTYKENEMWVGGFVTSTDTAWTFANEEKDVVTFLEIITKEVKEKK